MSRVYRFATIGIIWICAAFIHYFATIYFAPGTSTAALIEPGVGLYVDENWGERMYLVFVQHIPMLFVGGSLLWGFAKEYEDAQVGGFR